MSAEVVWSGFWERMHRRSAVITRRRMAAG